MSGDQDADEPPSLLWGLDPVFSAYARLYVKDLVQMRESRQVPGFPHVLDLKHDILTQQQGLQGFTELYT